MLISSIVRDRLKQIGYDKEAGFDCDSVAVLTSIDEQSPDIAMGVDKSFETRDDNDDILDNGAGDQGLMFGYANDDTEELMPLPIALAQKLAKRLAIVRKSGNAPFLRPDGKCQVTVEYEDDKAVRIDTVVVSTQHSEDISQEELHDFVIENIIKNVIPESMIDPDTKFFVNPTGRFVVGGPQGDSGLTGRKIIVDTYGGFARHGGGAFSGKDPTKVDRSAAYAARYIAKNVVAAGIAKECEIQLAYAIGVAKPVSVMADTFGTGVVPDEVISRAVNEVFDLRPTSIIRDLDLKRPIYSDIASYGHFGRSDLDLPWEACDRIDALKAACGLN